MSDVLRLSAEEADLVATAIGQELMRVYDTIDDETDYDPDEVLSDDTDTMVDMETAQTILCYHTLDRLHDRVTAEQELPFEEAWAQYLPRILRDHADALDAHHFAHDDRDIQATQLAHVADVYRHKLTANTDSGPVDRLDPVDGPETNAVNLTEANESAEDDTDE